MRQVLIICGPTATGKTSLALKLAHKFSGEIISADSRQVYKGMNVGTGKDIPRNIKYQISNIKYSYASPASSGGIGRSFSPAQNKNKKIPFYGNGTKIWGYDLAKPNQEFSVSHFVRIASAVINDIQRRNKLSIIVGGTGLYINSLLKSPQTIFIPQNKTLRQTLGSKSVTELQQELKKVNRKHFNQLNSSDKNNPRRLVRSIEVALYLRHHPPPKVTSPTYNPLWIGLVAPQKTLDALIEERVRKRAGKNMDQEVRTLIRQYSNWQQLPAFSATGYQFWRAYLEGKLSQKAALKLWVTSEKQYARRQLTWFRKTQKIHWSDVSEVGYPNKVVAEIKNWYPKLH
ncbi:MAG: tRNA dimethylallyltransferase [Candidatus Chisholmbacteria bacterium]|nr:tRNA dimethylallyltransferase [Candidatus Chisholmbacteria bacterium]